MTTPEQRIPDLPEADAYLREIGILGDMRVKIDECCKYYEMLFENTDYKIFISERKNKEGETIFENLWFFSEDGVSEYKNFVRSETSNLDFMALKPQISSLIDIHTNGFIPGSAGVDSTMSLAVALYNTEARWALSASGLNCEYLYEIFKFVKSST